MEIRYEDLKVESTRPSRQGGQHVGVHSGVRVTHIPTGTVAAVEGRSQHKSREIAMQMIEWALLSL